MKFVRNVRARLRDKAGSPWFTVKFEWDSDDPLAVRMDFPQEGQDLTWVFSRDLLHRGAFFKYSGEPHGDVAVWQEKGSVIISLRPPHGRADVECPKDEVRGFINDSITHTALGKEGPRVEAAIQNLIEDIWNRGA